MALHLISIPENESNIETIVSLDGSDYQLRFLWNDRVSRWFLTIRDSSGSEIVAGVKVIADAPLAAHVVDARMFPGNLWTRDTTGSGTDPGLRDLGRRVKLWYVDEDSVA